MENKEEKFIIRLSIVFLIIILIFTVIFARLLYIDVIGRGKFLAGIAPQLNFGTISMKAERGKIVDRNDTPVALGRNAWELDINPSKLDSNEKKLVLSKLPQMIGIDSEKLYSMLNNRSVYVRVSTALTDEQKELVESLNIKNGIALTRTKERIYPYGSLMANVVGFVGTDERGLSGIEYEFDNDLRGADGKVYFPVNANRPLLPGYSTSTITARKGDTVQLTIDANIQYVIEKYLKDTIEKTKAKDGVVIVMNPKTGEVLGMASYPTFDPNNLATINSNDIMNRAIQMNYEPGSVLKPVIAAAALSEGTLHTNDTFYCKGYLKVKDRILHCWRKHGIEHGLNVIMRNSCDVAFMKIGLKLGKEKLDRYFKRFGFGRPTGIELPGEESGILPDVRKIGDVELATMSYGQGIAVTPIQLITAFSAIANKGVEMKPTIVKKITDYKGKVIYSSTPIVKKTVISPKVAGEVMDALKAVVSDKGVPQAEIKGYSIAGKTGTAQKPDKNGGYSNDKLIYSFCGIVPANDPQVVVLTVIDQTEKPTYSLYVAAPLFKKIAMFLIKYLRIPPE